MTCVTCAFCKEEKSVFSFYKIIKVTWSFSFKTSYGAKLLHICLECFHHSTIKYDPARPSVQFSKRKLPNDGIGFCFECSCSLGTDKTGIVIESPHNKTIEFHNRCFDLISSVVNDFRNTK